MFINVYFYITFLLVISFYIDLTYGISMLNTIRFKRADIHFLCIAALELFVGGIFDAIQQTSF